MFSVRESRGIILKLNGTRLIDGSRNGKTRLLLILVLTSTTASDPKNTFSIFKIRKSVISYY